MPIKKLPLDENQKKLILYVARVFNTTATEILNPSRVELHVLARWAFMYYCRSKLKMTLKEIGAALSKDHATVMHGIERAQNERNQKFVSNMTKIKKFCEIHFPNIETSLTIVEKDIKPTYNFWEDNIDEPRTRPANKSRAFMRASAGA